MRTLHAAVLATRRLPGLSSMYEALYRGGAAAGAKALGALPGVESVILHRGLARGRLVPGVSDVDLILLRRALPDSGEAAWLAALGARWSALRTFFPPLGDLWVATREETALYLRRGGLRAWEDAPHWRALVGALPERPGYGGSPLKRGVLDPWTWAFVSFMDLSRRVWAPGADLPAKRDADVRKLYRETARLCLAVLTGQEPAPREAALPGPDPERGVPHRLWLAAAGLLTEASSAALALLGTAETATPHMTPDGKLESLRAACGAVSLVIHPPYHAVAVLGDAADGAEFERAAAGLAASGLAEAPLVLTESSWALALQSSYLGVPRSCLRSFARPTAGLFAPWETRGSGAAVAIPLLAPGLRREAAAEAASWMLLWWRALWASPSYSNRFVLHHLYSNALGLRAALSGREEESALREALERWAVAEPPDCVDRVPRAVLAAEHAATLAGLMRRLAGDAS